MRKGLTWRLAPARTSVCCCVCRQLTNPRLCWRNGSGVSTTFCSLEALRWFAALRRQRQLCQEFKESLGYTAHSRQPRLQETLSQITDKPANQSKTTTTPKSLLLVPLPDFTLTIVLRLVYFVSFSVFMNYSSPISFKLILLEEVTSQA